tara:strand:- start:1523 stop:2155 length:633 start_codon:yes stop_codon:yes gene_type:complete
MESTNEIKTLYTDGAIETITCNHSSEINAIRNKYDDQIKRIKGLHENHIKRLKEEHKKQSDDINIRHIITLQNTRRDLEDVFNIEISKTKKYYSNEVLVLQNEIDILRSTLKLNKEKLTQSMRYESEYINIKQRLDDKIRFIDTLRNELDKAVKTGKRAWDTFKKYCPEQYDSYIRFKYQNEDHSQLSLLENTQTPQITNDNIVFGDFLK